MVVSSGQFIYNRDIGWVYNFGGTDRLHGKPAGPVYTQPYIVKNELTKWAFEHSLEVSGVDYDGVESLDGMTVLTYPMFEEFGMENIGCELEPEAGKIKSIIQDKFPGLKIEGSVKLGAVEYCKIRTVPQTAEVISRYRVSFDVDGCDVKGFQATVEMTTLVPSAKFPNPFSVESQYEILSDVAVTVPSHVESAVTSTEQKLSFNKKVTAEKLCMPDMNMIEALHGRVSLFTDAFLESVVFDSPYEHIRTLQENKASNIIHNTLFRFSEEQFKSDDVAHVQKYIVGAMNMARQALLDSGFYVGKHKFDDCPYDIERSDIERAGNKN